MAGGPMKVQKLLISLQDVAELFDEAPDELDTTTRQDVDEIVDITSDEYILSMYQKVFNVDKIPTRDSDIIRTYCNEKSFERAITLCYRLLEKFSYLPSGVSNSCGMDTKIIVDCHDALIENKIPHCYKAGMIILLVLHRYHNVNGV